MNTYSNFLFKYAFAYIILSTTRQSRNASPTWDRSPLPLSTWRTLYQKNTNHLSALHGQFSSSFLSSLLAICIMARIMSDCVAFMAYPLICSVNDSIAVQRCSSPPTTSTNLSRSRLQPFSAWRISAASSSS